MVLGVRFISLPGLCSHRFSIEIQSNETIVTKGGSVNKLYNAV
jgi:hypothetical protein